MYTFFAPGGPIVVLPMRDGRMRFLAEVHDAPGTPLNLHPTQEELQAILDQVNDRAIYLRLAETLSAFLAKLRSAADTLDIQERQRIHSQERARSVRCRGA